MALIFFAPSIPWISKRILAALNTYGVLVFQGPKLTPEEQVAFAAGFGTLEPQNGVLKYRARGAGYA